MSALLRLRSLAILGLALSLGACSSTPEDTGSDSTSDDDDDDDRGRPIADSGDNEPDEDVQSDDDGATDTTPPQDVTSDTPSPDVDATPSDIFVPDTNRPDTTPTDTTPTDTTQPDALDDGCSAKLRFIYVMGKDKTLYQFDPDTAAFTSIGEVDCGEFSDTTPSSMAMSRLGVARINYSDSSLQTVDIDDAACTESDWAPNTSGFGRFGMGYVADTVGGDETLYIANRTQLGELDTDTWSVRVIGNLPSQSELSGTGNGELWGFFPLENPPQLRQLDREDASVITSYSLPPLPPNLDTFAFTAWGGEFYIFYRLSGLGETTTVYRFNRATEDLELVVEDTGINVVGAGVSICAPTSR
jgi:hypothetical protein